MDTQNERLRTMELFAGAGGGVLGALLNGHVPVCYVEREPYAQRVLIQRMRDGLLPDAPIWDDVRTFDGVPWRGRVDVVSGGFPCQDISVAGKGAGLEGARSGLWSEMARIVREVGPRYVFVENSPALTSRGLGVVLRDLAALGYNAEWGVLGARDVGAPHRRDRIWILAHADGERELQPKRGERDQWRRVGDGCKDVPHTDGERIREQQRRVCGQGGAGKAELAINGSKGPMAHADGERLEKLDVSALGDRMGQPARRVDAPTWWGRDPAEGPVESRVGRVVDGMADRVDRLRAIGNGQVSAVAASAWRLLMDRSRGA